MPEIGGQLAHARNCTILITFRFYTNISTYSPQSVLNTRYTLRPFGRYRWQVSFLPLYQSCGRFHNYFNPRFVRGGGGGDPTRNWGDPTRNWGGPNPKLGGPNPKLGGPNPKLGGPNPKLGGPNPKLGPWPNPRLGYSIDTMLYLEPQSRVKARTSGTRDWGTAGR
jgi:hypothetical protein